MVLVGSVVCTLFFLSMACCIPPIIAAVYSKGFASVADPEVQNQHRNDFTLILEFSGNSEGAVGLVRFFFMSIGIETTSKYGLGVDL